LDAPLKSAFIHFVETPVVADPDAERHETSIAPTPSVGEQVLLSQMRVLAARLSSLAGLLSYTQERLEETANELEHLASDEQ
jgi:hypothetical protein